MVDHRCSRLEFLAVRAAELEEGDEDEAVDTSMSMQQFAL